ncbi:hypothetical protein Trydic_g4764 [Trypoxylus dichotomus]
MRLSYHNMWYNNITIFNNDLLAGFITKQVALQVTKDLTKVLKGGYFELRKWCNNSQVIIKALADAMFNFNTLDHMVITDPDPIKTLGLQWNVKQDSFEYVVKPLTPLSDYPSDINALNHFLLGDSFTGYQKPELTQLKLSLLNRWQRLQKITRDIRNRWKKEYFSILQQRTKWRKENTNLKVEYLVLVANETTKGMDGWPLGRVLEIHPRADQLV